MATSFGPSALATPANLLTLGRLILTIPFLSMVGGSGASWTAVTLWIGLCLTDWADGMFHTLIGDAESMSHLPPEEQYAATADDSAYGIFRLEGGTVVVFAN